MAVRIIGAPKTYAALCDRLLLLDPDVAVGDAEHSPEIVLNFSLKDSPENVALMNPPALLRLMCNKASLYPWLRRHHLTMLPLVRAHHQGPWPLLALQNEPCFCVSSAEALASNAEIFAQPPAELANEVPAELWRYWNAGGQIITAERQHRGEWQPHLAPEILRRHNADFHRRYGSELCICHALIASQTVHTLDISLPQQIPDHLVAAIVSALMQSLNRAQEMIERKQLHAWQIIALFEPILQCALPPVDFHPWCWEFASRTEGTRARRDQQQSSFATNEEILKLTDAAKGTNVACKAVPPLVHYHLRLVQQQPWQGPWLLPADEPADPTRLILHPEAWRRHAVRNWSLLCNATHAAPSLSKNLLLARYHRPSRSTPSSSSEDISDTSEKPLPILGILTLPPRERGEPFGFESLHFKQLSVLAPGYGLRSMLFSAEDLDPRRNRCWGYEYRDARWQRKAFPLPDILYIRGISASAAQERQRLRVIDLLSKRGIPALNNLDFMVITSDKRRLHEVLSDLPAFAKHLPETIAFSFGNLRRMLRQYDTLFLKPQTGYEARGILRLSRNDNHSGAMQNDLFDVHYNNPEGKLQFWVDLTPDELHQRLRQLPLRKYLIQQGISPARWRNNSFELRCIVQQNAGVPEIMGRVIRLTGREDLAMITALREQWQPALPVLSECFSNAAEILAQAKDLALELAATFNTPPCRASEFALDFIIDIQGHLWVLEANAKPASFFVQIGEDDARRASLTAKLKQARWLLGLGPVG